MSMLDVGDPFELARRSSLFSPSRPEIAATSQVDASDEPEHAERSRRPVTPLENTYKMEPERRFNAKAVENIIDEVLTGQLEEESYEPRSSKQMAKTLSTIITNRVKALNFDRYKIVTLVTVGEAADQGVQVGSRCLFDQEKDSFASGSYRNASLFAVATVYGVYYE